MVKQHKLAQRESYSKGYVISVGLTGDIGYITIEDKNLYPESDSRYQRSELGYNLMMIPLMTREDLKDLHTAIGEVLKHSK
jgi:hypothetical protein